MNPDEEAIAVRDTRYCKIVPLSNGDLAVFDADNNLICIADIRPISFHGLGLGGLVNAIEIAVNKGLPTGQPFRIPIKGARRPGEYWETHQRTPTTGQAKYVPPTPVMAPKAQTVTSASQMGFVKVKR